MRRIYGDYISTKGWIPDDSRVRNILRAFRALFESVANGIITAGGEPDFSTIRVIYHTPKENDSEYTTIGVRIEGEFEEEEHERKTGCKGCSKDD